VATHAPNTAAFSTPAGRVAILWSVSERGNAPQISFNWQESGGPRVSSPGRKGFGTTLLNTAISGADAAPNIEYNPNGLRYTLEVALSAIGTLGGIDTTRGT